MYHIIFFQLLGFLDLYYLSLHSLQRRKQVFGLNTAGQPQVWENVCEQCLRVIKSLTERLSVGKKKLNVTTTSIQGSEESFMSHSTNGSTNGG